MSAVDVFCRFILPGSLCFDIGANDGQYTRWMLEAGAGHVVAIEPQADIFDVKRDDRVTFLPCLVSDSLGLRDFWRSPGHEYVSTVEADYRELVQQHAAYPYAAVPLSVSATTLDSLIAHYGVPEFCKIDVEGHELAVLQGLSVALPALSFEIHDFGQDKTSACMARINSLGSYRYQYSPRVTFELQDWPPDQIAITGDVYAVLDV